MTEFDDRVYDEICPTKEDLKLFGPPAHEWLKGKDPKEAQTFGRHCRNLIAGLEMDYGIHKDSHGEGGCLPLAEWLATPLADPLADAMRSILVKRILAGKCHYLHMEFAERLAGDCVIAYLIPCEDDE